ncbi:hypothetical protein ACLE20_12425 [Rhizobium sp. YIM 134829]|uniref:hypothetical protein n=1 Tax=Rhizobium sp. YIM 134829 TaxID=3390453 RepID=UPI00397C6D8D
MRSAAGQLPVTPPHHHVVTAREALEPLYLRLALEAEARLIKAGVEAGWSADDVVDALDALRREGDQPRH